MTSPTPLYTSRLSIPYSSKSTLNTLDIHTPTQPPLSPSYHLIYIHGGAFRDPLVTSLSLLPSLPLLFHETHHLASVASVNYRLCPHPTHPTHPSAADDRARNAKWPDAIEDVREAVRWVKNEQQGEGGGEWEWIVCGHSVGGTMAVMVGMDDDDGAEVVGGEEVWEGGMWGREGGMDGLKGVVALEGIYDFAACRDAHAGLRDMYDAFTTGAFGPEGERGWERGDVLGCGRGVRGGVEVVVVGHSREDELVEWGQGEGLVGVLEVKGKGKGEGGEVVRLVEVDGTHAQVVKDGVAVGRCVDVAVGVLVERATAKEGG